MNNLKAKLKTYLLNLIIKLSGGIKVKEGAKAGGYTARTKQTGDKVYLIKDNKKHWVKNPFTLEKLGFRMGDEKEIHFEDFVKFEQGEAIDLQKKGGGE